MTERNDEQEIRRILVAVDTSPHGLAALEAGIELAAEYGADVVGLFVEDLNLLRLAQLPFAREVAVYSARVRQIGREDLERQLRAQAARLRRQLSRRAMHLGVRWSFHVSRGDIAAELMQRAEQADLVILGKTGWSESRSMGSTARLLAAEARGRVLILQRERHLARALRVVFDGSESAQRALHSAALLADRERRRLSVLLLADGSEAIPDLRRQAADQLREHGLSARYRALVGAGPAEIEQAIKALDCVLVLPAELAGLSQDDMMDLLDRLECPMLVVR